MTHQPTSFIDCRGLSAPLTVLRVQQAMVGRSGCGLPLDVLVDGACPDIDRVWACLNGESTDIRLVHAMCGLPDMAALPRPEPGAAMPHAGHAHV